MKKKHVVIGDIHGRNLWRQIVEEYPDAVIVFLGDYCDPYPDEGISQEEVIDNLERIVRFKIDNPERVVLLVGNHDWPLLFGGRAGCSRHNPYLEEELKAVFRTHAALFQMAYEYSSLLFTHAGVVQYWFDEIFGGDVRQSVAAQLNDPTAYGLRFEDLYVGGRRRGGESPCGGILWADAGELSEPFADCLQIVGHNRVNSIFTSPSSPQSGIVFCDALRQREFLVIASSPLTHELFVASPRQQPIHLTTYFVKQPH